MDWEPHSFVELTLRKVRLRARVGSPQVGKKPEGWCGIDTVALVAAEAVIANFRPWIIYYHHAAIPRRIWANFWQHIC